MIRPTKKMKKAFLEYYAMLPVQKLAAERVGINEDTVTDWKAKDKEFSDQVGFLKSEWALKNSRLVRSKEWLLERVLKDHFAERTELAGPDGEELRIVLEKDA